MKKIALVGVFAALAISLAACGSSKKSSDSNTSTTVSATSQAKTFKAFLTGGATKHCTFSLAFLGNSSSGDSYTNGNGDGYFTYSSSVYGRTVKINMLVKGTEMYFWTEANGGTIGYKVDTSKANGFQQQLQNAGAFSLDKNTNFASCSNTVDNSKFEVPSNIQFMDFSAILGQVSTTIPPGSSNYQ